MTSESVMTWHRGDESPPRRAAATVADYRPSLSASASPRSINEMTLPFIPKIVAVFHRNYRCRPMLKPLLDANTYAPVQQFTLYHRITER
ncbi:flagellar biosynthetic protein FliQ [Salmonella enterica subsp. enterica]|nr:flagellar biosynthetic protein FliQ [Salmonella enterica subsp. enterica]